MVDRTAPRAHQELRLPGGAIRGGGHRTHTGRIAGCRCPSLPSAVRITDVVVDRTAARAHQELRLPRVAIRGGGDSHRLPKQFEPETIEDDVSNGTLTGVICVPGPLVFPSDSWDCRALVIHDSSGVEQTP